MVLLFESIIAFLPSFNQKRNKSDLRPHCAIIIPACNEETGLPNTLKNLLTQIGKEDRILVVADNCTDLTAEVALSFGVEVIERVDPMRRSKMHAVNHGVRFLELNPAPVVIVVDADCIVNANGIDRLVREVASTNQTIQASYWMENPPNFGPSDRISAFAFLYKNYIRPLGLSRLGFPCPLTGSGMAFPWSIIRDVPLNHNKLADDYSLTIDLALQGNLVRFCPEVEVVSELSPPGRGAFLQKKRWEQGHLELIFTQIPRLIRHAISQCKISPLILVADFCVLPLASLFISWFLILARISHDWGCARHPDLT